jgi:hypothetical protein
LSAWSRAASRIARTFSTVSASISTHSARVGWENSSVQVVSPSASKITESARIVFLITGLRTVLESVSDDAFIAVAGFVRRIRHQAHEKDVEDHEREHHRRTSSRQWPVIPQRCRIRITQLAREGLRRPACA